MRDLNISVTDSLSMLKNLSIVLALLCVSGYAGGATVDDLNSIRRVAGLPELTHSAELQAAAESHARYLARYVQPGGGSQISAHEQNAGLPEFSGRLVADRTRYFGYPHSQVIENVSLGNLSLDESISSLMSAIYHRFGFLDMKIDEIGIAQMQQRYVYNMGRKDLAQACTAQPEEARILPAHNCLGQNMKSSAYQDMCANLPAGARYSPPFSGRCANGALLNGEFMRKVCGAPPKGAILKGAGRYYDACNNGLKISAKWFDRVCQSTNPEVAYQHSGSSYQICLPEVAVHADWY
ncbi:MAG: CAP domain-containing protein, partial [Gammaproteobacteria bacterium]|nr:CAP domain-containing protein [Gammaproteobacteria bacterium]